MSPQRLVGVVMLVVGSILLIVGMNASNSVTDQVTNTFTGRFTQGTMWYFVSGAALAVLGLVLVLFGVRRRLS